MSRFSEQQARLGAFFGNGVNYVTAKTALTRSQWLMLMTFAVGAIAVGFVLTRWSTPQASQSETAIAANRAQVSPAPAKYRTPSAPAAVSSEPTLAGSSAPIAAAALPADTQIATVGQIQSPPATEPSTKSLLDGLAKEIAKINLKLDDLAGKQRQTATRLAALAADGKQARSRASDTVNADRPNPPDRKPVAIVAQKVATKTSAAPIRDLTVHPARKVRRTDKVDAPRMARVKAFIIERRIEIAQRNRRVRRRLASRTIFGRPYF